LKEGESGAVKKIVHRHDAAEQQKQKKGIYFNQKGEGGGGGLASINDSENLIGKGKIPRITKRCRSRSEEKK